MDAGLREFAVLGIETSCDETAAAIVRGRCPGPGEILSNVVFSQIGEHRPYGGVVPEIAARAHVEMLDDVIAGALVQSGLALDEIDAVAATAGPGLIGGVMVGLTTAKALALSKGKPFIGVNHLEGHALTARLTDGIAFPFLLLLMYGGHCLLAAVEGVGDFRLYGSTIDDAVGEAFDKTAKLLGLPYPGGPAIETLAVRGNAQRFALPRPLLGRAGADFSFAGLKTAVRQIVRGGTVFDAADLAASFQAAVTDVVMDRTRAALSRFRAEHPESAPSLAVAGGVAANSGLRDALADLCAVEDSTIKIAPPALCTDNAAMIAWVGVERMELQSFDSLSISPKARWPLQGVAAGEPPRPETGKNGMLNSRQTARK
jgi:N6-L-threonylcarbamoyladenine synthase